MTPLTRRGFLTSVAAAPLAAAAASTRLPIRKAVEFSMLPASLSVAARFQLARDAGFEEIECPTAPDQSQAEEMLAASKKIVPGAAALRADDQVARVVVGAAL